ncbi:MAG: alpha/beta hydrolase-fold protein [Acutalibacteraceae bacterium]
MKKIYKRSLPLVLSILMIFSAITFLFINADFYVVAAQTEKAETVSADVIGDADGNGEVNIQDVTCVQRYLVNLISKDEINLSAANVTGNEKLSINDATTMQRFLANLINRFPVEDVDNKVQVIFNVTIPEALDENDSLGIGTNLNNWNPANPEWFMTKIDELHYQLTAELDSENIGKEISYKYAIQNSQTTGQKIWARVEGTSSGGDANNRTFIIENKCNVINDTVAMFRNDFDNNTVTRGTVETFTLHMPQYSDNRTREIHVWLPDGYSQKDTDKKYPVFYMQDGQNLFDSYTSYAGEWMVDEAIADMMDDGYEGAVIVGIENSPDRWNEYSPEWVNMGSSLPNNSSAGDFGKFVDNPSGDKYGEFIVNTLKPYIDSHYNVRTDKNSTGIGGSSMGGLISYYIGMKYNDVFGQVLSFSPAFWMYSEDTIASVVDSYDYSNTDNLPKVFLYVGGANQMEKDTIPYVDLVYNRMIENSYPKDKLNALTDNTKDHNEAAWSEYFPQAYKWLVEFI